MIGAFVGRHRAGRRPASFLLALLAALAVAGRWPAWLVELVILRRLYQRDHLDQVLATFGADPLLRTRLTSSMVWGPLSALSGHVRRLSGSGTVDPARRHPTTRLPPGDDPGSAALGGGLGLYLADAAAQPPRHADPRRRQRTARWSARPGCRHQAALHPGVRIGRHAGGFRRGHGGAAAVGRGRHGRTGADPDLYLRGHRDRRHRLGPRRLLVGALLVGLVDTLGRAFLPQLLRLFMVPSTRRRPWRGAGHDGNLHPDGGRPLLAAPAACSRVTD